MSRTGKIILTIVTLLTVCIAAFVLLAVVIPQNNLKQAYERYGDVLSSAKPWDIITFGTYEQDGDESNGPEPIEWLVLDDDDVHILLVSLKALDCRDYNEEHEDITWQNCSLRYWLNGTFYNEAFDAEEKTIIAETSVPAGTNRKYTTEAGNATLDKVFILSIDDMEEYLVTDYQRQCIPTAYADINGAYVSSDSCLKDGKATCTWWLRSPGALQDYAACVYNSGEIAYKGVDANVGSICVRPAIIVCPEYNY